MNFRQKLNSGDVINRDCSSTVEAREIGYLHIFFKENVILLLVLVKNADRDQLWAWYPIEITNHQFQ